MIRLHFCKCISNVYYTGRDLQYSLTSFLARFRVTASFSAIGEKKEDIASSLKTLIRKWGGYNRTYSPALHFKIRHPPK